MKARLSAVLTNLIAMAFFLYVLGLDWLFFPGDTWLDLISDGIALVIALLLIGLVWLTLGAPAWVPRRKGESGPDQVIGPPQ